MSREFARLGPEMFFQFAAVQFFIEWNLTCIWRISDSAAQAWLGQVRRKNGRQVIPTWFRFIVNAAIERVIREAFWLARKNPRPLISVRAALLFRSPGKLDKSQPRLIYCHRARRNAKVWECLGGPAAALCMNWKVPREKGTIRFGRKDIMDTREGKRKRFGRRLCFR